MNREKINRLAKILRVLRSGDPGTSISGTYLAEQFGISRVMVSKYIRFLEKLGYVFDKRTGLGYTLIKEPDILHPVEIVSRLETRLIGRKYHYLVEADSTNDIAVALAIEGTSDGTCIVAESQRQGRGRLGRVWLSTPGKGIYMSLVLRPDIPPKDVSQLTLLAAMVLATTLRNLYGFDAKVKWPNDVVINGKKVAGILSESQIEPQRVRFIIIGIGVNVHHRKEDFLGPFRYLPTSVALEIESRVRDAAPKRQELFCEFLKNFEYAYNSYLTQGWESWQKTLNELSMVLGKYITVDTGKEMVAGIASKLSPDGGLIVRTPEGQIRTILVGDVVHIYLH